MSNYSITVTRSAQVPVTNGTASNYSFTVTASNGINIPNQIFVMLQQPLDPVAQTVTDVFSNVATPADLQNLPVNAPVPPGDMYRVAAFTYIYPDETTGEDAWAEIQANIQLLLDSLEAQTLLQAPETIIFTND